MTKRTNPMGQTDIAVRLGEATSLGIGAPLTASEAMGLLCAVADYLATIGHGRVVMHGEPEILNAAAPVSKRRRARRS